MSTDETHSVRPSSRRKKPRPEPQPEVRPSGAVVPVVDSLGRPNYGGSPLPIDLARLERLARSRRSLQDLALAIGTSEDSLHRRKDCRDAIDRGRARYRSWLQRRAMRIAGQDEDLKAAKDMVIHLDLREYGPIPKDEAPVQHHEHLHVLLEQPVDQIQAALAAAQLRERKALRAATVERDVEHAAGREGNSDQGSQHSDSDELHESSDATTDVVRRADWSSAMLDVEAGASRDGRNPD